MAVAVWLNATTFSSRCAPVLQRLRLASKRNQSCHPLKDVVQQCQLQGRPRAAAQCRAGAASQAAPGRRAAHPAQHRPTRHVGSLLLRRPGTGANMGAMHTDAPVEQEPAHAEIAH